MQWFDDLKSMLETAELLVGPPLPDVERCPGTLGLGWNQYINLTKTQLSQNPGNREAMA